MKKKQNKKKKWIRFRHSVVRNILACTLGVYARLKYHIKVERFKEQERRPYLVLLNHQTAYDQFFVGLAIKGPVYYLASEDIFSMGWVSSLIRYLVAPIPIKKQTTDVKAILNCIRVAKEGGTIAVAPEGNRTFSGRTEYMSDSIVPLARKLGMPVALYRLEGGYGVHPRWSDVVRRGKMRGYVSRVISPEEYANLSDEEFFKIIKEGLYVDEAVADAKFVHPRAAEYLERAIYVCPKCGLSTFESNKDLLFCTKCGLSARYTPTKEFEAVQGDLPFRFVADWYDYQADFIRHWNPTACDENPLYVENISLSEVIPAQRKELICKDAILSLFRDRMEIKTDTTTMEFTFEDATAVTVLGKNKLNVYHGGKIYQIVGSKRFNALKYVHIYNRCRNIGKGVGHEQFLGL